MPLVTEQSLRKLFHNVKVGKEYKRNGQPYSVVAKTILTGDFDGEAEFWFEIEFEGPDARYFVQFDYGVWTISRHIGSYQSGEAFRDDDLCDVRPGGVLHLLDQHYLVQETAETWVIDVQGQPADGTAVGESFRYADLSSTARGVSFADVPVPPLSIEWDPQDCSRIELFSVESLAESDAMEWLGISLDPGRKRLIQEIVDDENYSDADEFRAEILWSIPLLILLYLVEGFDYGESREECMRRVQSQYEAQGIPAGESIRIADVECSSARRRARSGRSFGK